MAFSKILSEDIPEREEISQFRFYRGSTSVFRETCTIVVRGNFKFLTTIISEGFLHHRRVWGEIAKRGGFFGVGCDLHNVSTSSGAVCVADVPEFPVALPSGSLPAHARSVAVSVVVVWLWLVWF